MDELRDDVERSGLSRRTVVAGAAWAVPVIAVAGAAPMAAASPGQANITAGTGGSITADGVAGTANGTLAGQVNITNVVNGPWETGPLSMVYSLNAVWATGDITKPGGGGFTQGENITVDGVVWTVASISQDASGVYQVNFTAPSQSVSTPTTFVGPSAIYSGTFTPGVPTSRNPISASVAVAATNVNGGAGVGTANQYPAPVSP